MNDGLDIPEVDFLETAAFAFLVFEGKSLQLLRANRCAEQWYELSGTEVLQDLFPRVNVARLQRKLRSGKSFKTAVESDGASSVPSVAQLEVLRFVKQGVELYAAFVVDVASVGERAAIYRSFATLAEADSKTQRRRLASFPEENPNPVLATDLRGEIVYTNPGMDLLVSQLNLNSARELLPSEHIEVVTGARGSGEAESSVGDRIFLWSYHRLAEQHEVHIYGREITAIRTAEQERSRALAELERGKRNQAIGQLAGGFAHDFNNLLAVIAGYTDLALEQRSEDETLRGHLEHVRVAAERGRSIVNQILAFARGERVQFEKVDAKAMLVEVLALLRGSLAEEVNLISDLGDGSSDDFHVNGDMVKLEQVVMNLVNNSEHALPAQSGEIRVSLCREASYIVIRVSDNGRGMPPDVRDRIFEPYFTTKRMSGGTGLGLAMVHGIIEEHSGLIEVESEEGRGTTFTIRLPEFASNLDHVANELRRVRPLGSRKPTTKMGPETKIMVVDDEAALARLAVRVLDRFGLRAESFTDPELALQTLTKNSGDYSVVITDQSMPGLTGLELMREVREKCPDIPVILCSGYGVELTEEQVLAGGGEALLWKPVDWDALVSLVRELSG